MRMFQSYCCIVNPAASGGKCRDQFLLAEALMKELGLPFSVCHTDGPGHAAALVEEAIAAGADCIVVAGGDGTVREVLQPVIGHHTPLCIFPFGTGNDLARFLKLPAAPEQAVQQLVRGTVRQVDAARVNSACFINVAGFGFDVEVLKQTERYKKRLGKKGAYIAGLLQALIHLKQHRITLTVDGVSTGYDAMIASAGNGRYIGGGMLAHPKAEIGDGLLDLCIIHDVKKRRVPPILMRFLKGRHLGLPETTFIRTAKAAFASETPLTVQLDGELIEQTPFTLEALPGAVSLVMTESSDT